MSIHKRIKERRTALGITSHKALADLLGVSWQTVQLWEKEGGTAPNRSRLQAVAAVLQVSPQWLLTGEEESAATGTAPVDPEIQAVVEMMKTTDAEGRILAKNAVIDALSSYQRRQGEMAKLTGKAAAVEIARPAKQSSQSS